MIPRIKLELDHTVNNKKAVTLWLHMNEEDEPFHSIIAYSVSNLEQIKLFLQHCRELEPAFDEFTNYEYKKNKDES